jgi:hypothetical protein
VELGALVVTQGTTLHSVTRQETNAWCSTWPVVGKTIVERWVERVQELGVGMVSVVDRDVSVPNRIQRMIEWAKEGVDQILVIFMGSYAEIDFSDLLRFHHSGGHRITRVFDPQGPLGVSLLDRRAVIKATPYLGGEPPRSSRYDFSGYVTRLSSTLAYRKLVQDALEGRCNIRPAGNTTDERVWIDPTASIHSSVKIQAPCYIGAHSKLNAGVTITGFSSVEDNCEIDVGTTLECASVLPNTYLAAGLHIHNAVVNGTKLEHLDRGVTVDLEPTALAARRRAIYPETQA